MVKTMCNNANEAPSAIFGQCLAINDAPRHTPGYRVVQRPLVLKNVFSSVMIDEISGDDAEAVQVHNKKA